MQEGCCSNDALFWTLPLDRVLALLSAIALVATAFVLYPYHKAVNLFQNPVRWREVAERTPGQSSATPQATAADAEACSSSRDITLAEAAPQALPETDEVLDGGDDASLKNLPEFASGVRSVVFDDGAAYNGEWRNGKMHGRGVFLWPTGDRYEGEWKDGEQDGQGTFAAADGSVYYGGWSHGKMDGEGVYKPGMLAASAAGAHQATVGDVIFLRRYVQGKLMKEVSLRMKDAAQKKQVKESRKKQSLGGRPLQPGEVIYKGHHSYDLMRQLQLGIMYSIAQAGLTAAADLTSKDYTEETVQYFPSSSTGDASAFKYKDYAPKVFHKLRAAFHIDNADYLVSLTGGPALRELPSPGASGCIFFLSSDDRFLIKSVRKEEMALLLGLVKRYYRHVAANPRTLLVHFYGLHRISPWLGRNARFLVMGNVLPSNKRMHRKYDLKGSTYKRTAGKEKMDSEPGATLKDLDIDIKLELAPAQRVQLMAQLESDAAFLQSLGVIDYSLLMGLHFVRWGESEWYPPFTDWPGAETTQQPRHERSISRVGSMAAGRTLIETLQDLSSAGVEPTLSRTAAVLVSSANTIRHAARAAAAAAVTAGKKTIGRGRRRTVPDMGQTEPPLPAVPAAPLPQLEEVQEELLVEEEAVPGEQRAETLESPTMERRRRAAQAEEELGWSVPAFAVRRSSTGALSREPVLLFFGIIDFLQPYNARKRVERAFKVSMHGSGVSVADPKQYAKRFLGFVGSVFVDEGKAHDVL